MNTFRTICAVETSCDETAVAIVRDRTRILSDVIYSQIDIHKEYGGVVPEIASRKHAEKIYYVFREALDKAGIAESEVDAFAATMGPGLAGALLTGLTFAKTAAYFLGKPFIPVNHILGHIYANFLSYVELKPPFIAGVVSGGHTHIFDFRDHDEYSLMGRTRDDAAGEVFDKVARALGLGYPGGLLIDMQARNGDPLKYPFPKTVFEDNKYDFSFSGIKTAVIYFWNKIKQSGEIARIEDVCASFQKTVCDSIAERLFAACADKGYDSVCLSGGVAANSYLRAACAKKAEETGFKLYIPPVLLCTDNAAMIASRAFYSVPAKDFMNINAQPGLKTE